MIDLEQRISDRRAEGGLVFREPTPLAAAAAFTAALGRVRQLLLERHAALLRRSVTDAAAWASLKDAIAGALLDENIHVPGYQRMTLALAMLDEIAGLGALEPLLRNPDITDIYVNAPDKIYIQRGGRMERAGVSFPGPDELLHTIYRIADRLGRTVSEAHPLLDSRLPDGSRVNCAIPPASLGSPTITIRKHTAAHVGITDLLAQGQLTEDMADFLERCVRGRLNLVVAGATGAGKTTLLRVLSSFIPPEDRVITCEDTEELQLYRILPHCLAREATQTVTVYDLVINALREDPDRLIVGEVRRHEGWALIEAMSTGHDGSATTVHSRSGAATVRRLVRVLLHAGLDITADQLEMHVREAVDLVVFIRKWSGGRRRIAEVRELSPDGDRVLYQYEPVTDTFQRVSPLSPEKCARLLANGVDLPPGNHHPEVSA